MAAIPIAPLIWSACLAQEFDSDLPWVSTVELLTQVCDQQSEAFKNMIFFFGKPPDCRLLKHLLFLQSFYNIPTVVGGTVGLGCVLCKMHTSETSLPHENT